jgi:hypothetical protein
MSTVEAQSKAVARIHFVSEHEIEPGAIPVSNQTRSNALRLLSAITATDLAVPAIFADTDGEIHFEWIAGRTYTTVIMENESTSIFQVNLDANNDTEVSGVTPEQTISVLQKFLQVA